MCVVDGAGWSGRRSSTPHTPGGAAAPYALIAACADACLGYRSMCGVRGTDNRLRFGAQAREGAEHDVATRQRAARIAAPLASTAFKNGARAYEPPTQQQLAV